MKEFTADTMKEAVYGGYARLLDRQDYEDMAGAALDLFSDTLLSKPVVEAMADHIQLDGEHYYAFKDRNGEIAHDIRAALTAALVAMGAVTED